MWMQCAARVIGCITSGLMRWFEQTVPSFRERCRSPFTSGAGDPCANCLPPLRQPPRCGQLSRATRTSSPGSQRASRFKNFWFRSTTWRNALNHSCRIRLPQRRPEQPRIRRSLISVVDACLHRTPGSAGGRSSNSAGRVLPLLPPSGCRDRLLGPVARSEVGVVQSRSRRRTATGPQRSPGRGRRVFADWSAVMKQSSLDRLSKRDTLLSLPVNVGEWVGPALKVAPRRSPVLETPVTAGCMSGASLSWRPS